MGDVFSTYEQPEFETLEVREGAPYQLRKYKAAKWTSTSLKGKDFDESTNGLFRKLFRYITGTNATKEKVSMTVPVTMNVSGNTDETQVVMSFYLPEKYQENAPEPTGEGVYTESREEMKVYVRTFGGRAYGKDWTREIDNLKDDLKKDGITEDSLDLNSYYAVGYDSPFRLIWRTNEVWIKKKEECKQEVEQEPVKDTDE